MTKLKLRPFTDILHDSPEHRWNEKKNYLTISHTHRRDFYGGISGTISRSTCTVSTIINHRVHNIEHTGIKSGRLGLVAYMRRYFGTEVSIKPKMFRNGRINPHICTVLGAKGQELFDAFDEWFVTAGRLPGSTHTVSPSSSPDAQQLGRQEDAREVDINLTLLSWDQLFEV